MFDMRGNHAGKARHIMIREIHNDILRVRVNEHGAELYSVVRNDGTEYIWQGCAPYWDGRAMNIFPNCGRFFDGRYTYRGKEYSIKCHGVARDADFVLMPDSSADTLVFGLDSNDVTRASYPFDFSLRISYHLDGESLECRNFVTNTGDDILPFSTGAHPGFNVPLTAGNKFSDYRVDFGNVGQLVRTPINGKGFIEGEATWYPLMDGRYIELDHHLFDNDAIFFENVPSSVSIVSDKDRRSVTLTCPQVRRLGLWHTNQTDAPFVCIEPWLGVPSRQGVIDDLATRPDMIRLTPGDSFAFDYTISFN